jgi:hypothetical protein
MDTTTKQMTAHKWTRADFEAEACLRILATIAAKDSISHVDQAQVMAQTLCDALQRRGFFGESNAVTEETRAAGVVRYQPQRRTQQNNQQREAVEIVEQF